MPRHQSCENCPVIQREENNIMAFHEKKMEFSEKVHLNVQLVKLHALVLEED
jgi:hypothetical protein